MSLISCSSSVPINGNTFKKSIEWWIFDSYIFSIEWVISSNICIYILEIFFSKWGKKYLMHTFCYVCWCCSTRLILVWVCLRLLVRLRIWSSLFPRMWNPLLHMFYREMMTYYVVKMLSVYLSSQKNQKNPDKRYWLGNSRNSDRSSGVYIRRSSIFLCLDITFHWL